MGKNKTSKHIKIPKTVYDPPTKELLQKVKQHQDSEYSRDIVGILQVLQEREDCTSKCLSKLLRYLGHHRHEKMAIIMLAVKPDYKLKHLVKQAKYIQNQSAKKLLRDIVVRSDSCKESYIATLRDAGIMDL